MYEPLEDNAFTFVPVGAKQGLPNENDFVQTVQEFPPVCSVKNGEVCTFTTTPDKVMLAGPASAPLTLCPAWQDNACCSPETTSSVQNLFQYIYMDGFLANTAQCGTLSQSCLNWFISNACFYQCDINAGTFVFGWFVYGGGGFSN